MIKFGSEQSEAYWIKQNVYVVTQLDEWNNFWKKGKKKISNSFSKNR